MKKLTLLNQTKYMRSLSSLLLAALFIFIVPELLKAQSDGEVLDQVVAVVNDHTILKSDVDQQTRDYMMQLQQQQGQQIPFSEGIWYSVLQNIIDRYVVLDQAKKDSVNVTEEQVDQRINDRINQFVEQLGSEQALEEQLGKSIVQLRTELRKDYRQQMVVNLYQQQKRTAVTITRPEVEEYFKNIPKDSLPTVPERVAVSQIVRVPAPLSDAREAALDLAKALRDSIINHSKSLEDLAERHSDGPSAARGGALGMIPVNDLVGEYSAAAAALEPGEISEIVETSFGFHIIRLNKRVGDQIDTNHILIELDKNKFDTEQAINRLKELKDSVLTNKDVTFATVAREFSEDPNTAPNGGRILNPQTGERLMPLDELDPALYRIVLLLENEGDISEPKQFNIGSGNQSKEAYRIVRLDQHVPEHTANLKQDYERIKRVALQEKQYRKIQNWISGLKEKFYIEYKIPIPEQYKNI
ncbi:MAG: peptidylprolyl isomerase [Balneolaceae bacterium]|nr:peptidylprolyl isomerase [Balneolaceae bacterium]